MSLLSLLKKKPKVDWQERKLLLQQLEAVWMPFWDFRFGQFISNVYEAYRVHGFDVERGIPIEHLSDNQWMMILACCSQNSYWISGAFDPDIHLQERNPDRIPGIVKALETYWQRFPHMRLGQVVQGLADTDQRLIYPVADRTWMNWFGFSTEK